MFCKGKGTQSSGLICISCRGRGSFDIIEKTGSCGSCKGTGRATIKTLPCISCGGKGFVILPGTERTFKAEEEKAQKTITLKKKATNGVGEPPRIKQEFSEEYLDSLQEKLTEILESPY